MIVPDSSVWIDFFRDAPTRQVALLADLIPRGRVMLGDLIVAEVLQGCDTDREFDEVREIFDAFPSLDMVGADAAIQAGRHYRRLRSLGITVRKTIDTLIATRCIRDDIPLLYSDRDFDPFVRHLGLRSALELPGVH